MTLSPRPAVRALLMLSFSLTGLAATPTRRAPATNQPMVDDYRITVLSDMVPGRRTIGEWGFSALVEVRSAGVTQDRTIQFNTSLHNTAQY